MKQCSPFGPMLKDERIKRGVQLWRFASSVPFPVANIQRIEAGLTEPRIGLAMKMLMALDIDAGGFMEILADTQKWQKYPIPDGFSVDSLAGLVENLRSEHSPLAYDSKQIFGLYFRKVRLACNLTQAEIAARAGYTTRSLIAVESGKQEPMVMRALGLAQVTGISVSSFFTWFSEIMKAGLYGNSV